MCFYIMNGFIRFMSQRAEERHGYKYMNFFVEKIAKVHYADIAINGITVIAGENDTGKSTIGKALYSIFNSFYQLDDHILEERWRMIEAAIRVKLSGDYFIAGEITDVIDRLRENPSKYISPGQWPVLQELLEEIIFPMEPFEENEKQEQLSLEDVMKSLAERIKELLDVPNEVIHFRILQQRLNAEFSGAINHVSAQSDAHGSMTLSIRKKNFKVEVKKQQVTNLSNVMSLNTQAIYIDNPFVLDDMAKLSGRNTQKLRENKKFIGHKVHLLHCLLSSPDHTDIQEAIENSIAEQHIENIMQKLDNACEGEIISKRTLFSAYQYVDKTGMEISLSNISAGMKTFMLLKQLLRNGYLEEKGMLILDEPEIHLHPEWQILFAEIIVLLQKEYNMHILLTTHSPYFLRALEVYSANYSIANKCKYYLSVNNETGQAILQDVTTKTNLVYDKLLQPFEELQLEQYSK